MDTIDATGPRILLILPEFPPRVGGMQTHALYLSQHLARRGYPIEVATYRPADAEDREASTRLDARLPFPVRRGLSRLGFWHNVDFLVDLGRRFRPDLVYSSTVFYSFVGEQLGVPVVCRSVGNDVLRPWIAYPFRPGSRLLSRPWLERRLYDLFRRLHSPEWLELIFRDARRALMEQSARAAALILANSAYTERLLREIGMPAGRIEVVVGGVDTGSFVPPTPNRRFFRRRLGLPRDRYLILTVCRQEEKKGIDFLLRALAALSGRMPDAHLVVVGDGRHGERYRLLAGELGLHDRVTFTGSVPHQTIHPFYWCADLFVLPSREHVDPTTGLRDVETMGRVLCEANAAGVSVVAARSGGIPSVIEHGRNGLLFEPDDREDFLAQVTRLRADRDLGQRLVEHGLRAARDRFDWSVILDAHERAFARVLDRAGAAGPAAENVPASRRHGGSRP